MEEGIELKEKTPVVNNDSLSQDISHGAIDKEEPEGDTAKRKPYCDNFCKFEPDLVPFKLFYLSFFGAVGAIFPFMSLYFKQLGFSPNQIGLISGVRPLIGFCSGPVWGSLADKFRIRKILLIISTLGWLGFILGIGFVPPASLSSESCPTGPFTSISESLTNNYTNHTRVKRLAPIHSNAQHVKTHRRPGATESEKLLEDRGWMFDQVDLERVFIVIIVLVILGEVVQSPTSSLADSGCLEHLGNDNLHKYGYQRSWGSAGFAIVSLSAGAVITTTRTDVTVCGISFHMSDYRLAFYFFAGCMALVFISALQFKFSKQKDDKINGKPEPEVGTSYRMFLSLHYGSWLFTAFFMGVCNGVIWSFLYWHLENIGASQLLVGLGSLINSVSEIIMFFVIFIIFKRISYATFMALGILGYVARFLVFAVIENPWWVLPVEILQGFTYAGVWSALTAYICMAVPDDNLATMQGILHGVYWGLGSGTGAMMSGILVEKYGARVTFWVFCIGSAVNLILFCIAQKCSSKPNSHSKYEEIVDSPNSKKDKNEQ